MHDDDGDDGDGDDDGDDPVKLPNLRPQKCRKSNQLRGARAPAILGPQEWVESKPLRGEATNLGMTTLANLCQC